MHCPRCGEKRVSWKKELWGAGAPQFWHLVKEVKFLCGGRYIYDEEINTYEETHPCEKEQNAS